VLALLALASSAVWGSSDFLAGHTARRLPAAAVVAWSQAIALVVLSVIISVRGEWQVGPWLPYAVGAGAVGAVALVCFYAAMAAGTMGVVAPIASLGVIVPVVVGLLRGDRPSAVALVGIVVAVAGVALASGPELSGGASARPVVLAAVAGAGFGVVLLLIDLGARSSVLHTLWGMRMTSVVAFAVAAVALRSVGGVRASDLPVLGVVGVADATANALFGIASSSGMVSLASVLGSLYPVVTVAWARVVLHERLSRVQLLGVALTAVGAAAIAF
jgi:drug/metabolite transporter (DMT)-like permease